MLLGRRRVLPIRRYGPAKGCARKAVSYFQKRNNLSPKKYPAYAYCYDVWIVLPKLGAHLLPKETYIDYNQDIKNAKATRLGL